eukprot:3447180-Prorocentrum_lima.AAC.1
MTSSLVGSEMCIRDRKYQTPLNQVVTTTCVDNESPHAEVMGSDRHPECCLLYTSDAADDM